GGLVILIHNAIPFYRTVTHHTLKIELSSQLRTNVVRQRAPSAEVDVTYHPARPVSPRQNPKRRRNGHDHDVGVARKLVDPEPSALDEHRREDAVSGVEAVDRA